MKNKLKPVVTVRLFCEEKCFGPGIAELLQGVEELHSLRASASQMNMAYSKAWTMVKRCENALDCKLLAYQTGGKNGGGAVLTDFGRDLLTSYTAYCKTLETLSKDAFTKHFSHML